MWEVERGGKAVALYRAHREKSSHPASAAPADSRVIGTVAGSAGIAVDRKTA